MWWFVEGLLMAAIIFCCRTDFELTHITPFRNNWPMMVENDMVVVGTRMGTAA